MRYEQKRLQGEKSLSGKEIYFFRQEEYQVILGLSEQNLFKFLCEMMGVLRNSFYHWKKRLINPSERNKSLANNICIFE